MLTKPRILIVEDEALFAMQLEMQLTRFGYAVTGRVSTGEQSVHYARETCPDLILMDIRLAGEMDGISAVAAIRAFCQSPVIFMTGYPDDEIVDRALSHQPAEYLVKPVLSEILRKKIEGMLAKRTLP